MARMTPAEIDKAVLFLVQRADWTRPPDPVLTSEEIKEAERETERIRDSAIQTIARDMEMSIYDVTCIVDRSEPTDLIPFMKQWVGLRPWRRRDKLMLLGSRRWTKPSHDPRYLEAEALKSFGEASVATIAADLGIPESAVRASCDRLEVAGKLSSRMKRWTTQSQKQRRLTHGKFFTPHERKTYFAKDIVPPPWVLNPYVAPLSGPTAPSVRPPYASNDAMKYARRAAQSYRTGKGSDSSQALFAAARDALISWSTRAADADIIARTIAQEVWAEGPGPLRTGIINVEPRARRSVEAALKRMNLSGSATYASAKQAIEQGVARANAMGRFVVNCREWEWRELMQALDVPGVDSYRD